MVECGEVMKKWMVLYGNPQMGRVTQLAVRCAPFSSHSTSQSQSEKPREALLLSCHIFEIKYSAKIFQIKIFGNNISDKNICQKWKVKLLLLLLISLNSFPSFRYICHHHGVAPPPLTLPLPPPLNEYFQSDPIQMERTPVWIICLKNHKDVFGQRLDQGMEEVIS